MFSDEKINNYISREQTGDDSEMKNFHLLTYEKNVNGKQYCFQTKGELLAVMSFVTLSMISLLFVKNLSVYPLLLFGHLLSIGVIFTVYNIITFAKFLKDIYTDVACCIEQQTEELRNIFCEPEKRNDNRSIIDLGPDDYEIIN